MGSQCLDKRVFARDTYGGTHVAGIPPPLVQAAVNDQKWTAPTPRVPWTRALLTRYTVTWYVRRDMVHHSETQGANYATKALMPQSASLTQNRNITHLKARVSDSTRSTQYDRWNSASPKSAERKLTEATPSVAGAWALVGTRGGGGGGGGDKALVVGSV